jgi:hypothetical protein
LFHGEQRNSRGEHAVWLEKSGEDVHEHAKLATGRSFVGWNAVRRLTIAPANLTLWITIYKTIRGRTAMCLPVVNFRGKGPWDL